MEYKKRDFSHVLKIDDLPEDMLQNHLNLYEGYIKNLNKALQLTGELDSDSYEYTEVKRRLGWEYGGVVLHELYFEAMSAETKEIKETSKLYEQIEKDFGSYDSWKKDFQATGRMRGIGWVALYYDKHREALFNVWIEQHDKGHFAGAVPILIMDMFEHAWMVGGLDRADYMEAYMEAVNWDVVEKRIINS